MFTRQTHAKSDTAPTSTGSATTYVDATSEFSGKLKLEKCLHVDGAVEGEIECGATLTIGASGRVHANVRAETVVIDGEIHGDIAARGEITLGKTARVYGDLATEGIVIERGAKVEGRITIGPVADPNRKALPSPSVAAGAAAEKKPATS